MDPLFSDNELGFAYNQVQQLRFDIQKAKGDKQMLWHELAKALDDYNQQLKRCRSESHG